MMDIDELKNNSLTINMMILIIKITTLKYQIAKTMIRREGGI